MASPCLVLPSNITDTSLVICPCAGKDSSFLKIWVIYCARLELLVRWWPFFSSRECSLSILLMGIPAFRNSSTISCLYACWAKTSVLSWRVFSRLSAWAIVCSFNFDLLFCFDLTCFCDAQCNLMTLFLDDKISLQASQKIFLPLMIKNWSGNRLIWSCKETLFLWCCTFLLYAAGNGLCQFPQVLAFSKSPATASLRSDQAWPTLYCSLA